MISRIATSPTFLLRFYEQSVEKILAVIESARRAHPGIECWTYEVDPGASKPCVAATLRFKDKKSLDSFANDEQFIDVYLKNAWGRRPLTRDALRVHPARGDERGTIPSDMFSAVGI